MAPIDFFDKVLNYYRKDIKKDEPVLAPRTAVLLSITYTIIYVLPFYLSSATRPSPQLSRDAPSVIRARIRAVILSSIVTTLITIFIVRDKAHLSPYGTLNILGWWPVNVPDIARSLLLIAILFAGPLFEAAIVEGRWKSWLTGGAFRETFTTTIGWRNYIAGPLTEETTFRSALLPLHLLTHASPPTLILTTPLYFGFAHIHHLYESRLVNRRHPITPLLLRTALQFTYTTIFGWYAAFVFLRTGSLWSAVLAHAFANWMGLPRFWGRVEAPVTLVGGGGVGGGDTGGSRGKDDIEMSVSTRRQHKDDHDSNPPTPRTPNGQSQFLAPSSASAVNLNPANIERPKSRSRSRASSPAPSYPRGPRNDEEATARHRAHAVVTGSSRLNIAWTLAYYALLVAGAVGFYLLLFPLTQSSGALVDFGSPTAAGPVAGAGVGARAKLDAVVAEVGAVAKGDRGAVAVPRAGGRRWFDVLGLGDAADNPD